MPTLRALPNANFAIGRHRYTSNAEGLIENVEADDVAGLLVAGCVSTDPWFSPPLRHEPVAKPERKPSVRMQSPAPHQHYAPASGVRYSSDSDGYFLADAGHVVALEGAGCKRIRGETA